MITAQLVKKLREISDAGMMDCKNALVQCAGDIDKALQFLREKGLAAAAKKSDRIAAEGVISLQVADDFSAGTLVEVNSETDFVAKNEIFLDFVARATDFIVQNGVVDPENLKNSAQKIDDMNFTDFVSEKIAKIGENIRIRRIFSMRAGENEIVNGYLHANKKVGVLLRARCGKNQAALLRNLCMHIAAMKPVCVDFTDFAPDFIASEKAALIAELMKQNDENKRLGKPLVNVPEFVSRAEITPEILAQKEEQLKNLLREQKKPEHIWDKILPGQIERFFADNTLLDQRLTLLGQFFVMDDKKTIAQILKNENVEIVEFARFELGEGIEKRADDFASEVAAQIK